MDIIFIAEDNGETLFIPVVREIGEITTETKDEEVETINGQTLNLIGGKGLRSFSFSSFFPSKKYDFVSLAKYREPKDCVEFFERYRDLKIPLRIIIVDRYKVVLNMLCRYTFTYQIRDKAGDIPFTLDIKEYILPKKGINNV